jgi:hypothetical protein
VPLAAPLAITVPALAPAADTVPELAPVELTVPELAPLPAPLDTPLVLASAPKPLEPAIEELPPHWA